MKTTVEIPEDLFREAKAKAALEGRKMKDFLAEGLRLRINQGPPPTQRRVKFPLIKSRNKRLLNLPDDVASQVDLADDLKRCEASLR